MKTNPERDSGHHSIDIGIYVRAETPAGKWVTTNIMHLDKPSLLKWLRSRGGDNPWAENVVGILMGYGPLHDE